MGPITSLSIYLVLWWVVLFGVLPWGVQSHHEAGTDPKDGGDPGAPIEPMLKKKFLITTAVSAVIFAVIWVVATFDLLTLPRIAQTY